MDRDTNQNVLTDTELAQVSGGAIPVVAGAALVGIGMLAGYGAVRLVGDITATGTLKAGLQKH